MDEWRPDTGAAGGDVSTEAMTQVRALKLAQRAIDYLLTGSPALDTFDQKEVNAAWHLLLNQWNAGKGKRRPVCQPILDLSEKALGKVDDLIEFGGRGGTGLSVSRQRPKLETAALVLPRLVAEIEAEDDAYWAEFAAAALEEAMAVIDEAVQL